MKATGVGPPLLAGLIGLAGMLVITVSTRGCVVRAGPWRGSSPEGRRTSSGCGR
jgi:hypothetical protein